MPQIFDHGELTLGSTPIGIFDISMDVAHTEHDVTNLSGTAGESEFIGGKRVVSFSFSLYKEANTDDLTLNSAATATFKVKNGSGAYNSYSGSLILFSKNYAGKIDAVDVMKYSGKITGAFTETKGAGGGS